MQFCSPILDLNLKHMVNTVRALNIAANSTRGKALLHGYFLLCAINRFVTVILQLQPHPITIWEGIMEMAEEVSPLHTLPGFEVGKGKGEGQWRS